MSSGGPGEELERCVASGGVAVFPTDTVYGLCCDPESEAAVARLYALKGRAPGKPAAIMFFAVSLALAALPELEPRTRAAVETMLPGPFTLLLPNPGGRYPLAGGDALGLRVPVSALALDRPVLQSSANHAGGADARCLDDVPAAIRQGADLVLDGGELPGVPSTVLDLRDYERSGSRRVVRGGTLETPARARRWR